MSSSLFPVRLLQAGVSFDGRDPEPKPLGAHRPTAQYWGSDRAACELRRASTLTHTHGSLATDEFDEDDEIVEQDHGCGLGAGPAEEWQRHRHHVPVAHCDP